jgi:NADPH-dependent F420 reductase
MKITIIGAGNMGRGIGARMLAGGNDVEVIDHDPSEARQLARELADGAAQNGSPSGTAIDSGSISGDIVVLAVWYASVPGLIDEYRDQLAGKVVVDITNPVDPATYDRLVTPADSSAAQEIAKLLPQGARLVKAFNTTFAGTLAAGEAAGQQLDVLLASDDDDAKRMLAGVIEASGLQPLDAGPLSRAQQLEHLGLLHMTIQGALNSGYSSTVKIHW